MSSFESSCELSGSWSPKNPGGGRVSPWPDDQRGAFRTAREARSNLPTFPCARLLFLLSEYQLDEEPGQHQHHHLSPSHRIANPPLAFASPSTIAAPAMAVPFTPARPMPGIYMQTPAPARPAQPQFGRAASSSSLKPIQSQDQSRLGQSAQQPQAPSSENAAPEQQGSQASATRAITTGSIQPQMTPIERAAQTINNMLEREARYPDAEQYIPRKESRVHWHKERPLLTIG
jgi:hypothetical protein